MKTSLIFILILVQGWILTQAQVPVFDLSKYARPTLSRKSLDLNFGLAGQQDRSLRALKYGDGKGNSMGGGANLGYRSFRNSPKYQENTSVYLRLQPNRSAGGVEGISTYNQNSFNGFLSINSIRLKYTEKQTFVGWLLDFNYSMSSQKSIGERIASNNPGETDIRGTLHSGRLDLPVVVGKGRIERVDDARHGLFILQELQKRQHLAREVNEEDILDFAEKISELKNRRYFDFRLQKIWELEQIHAYLLEQGIVSTQDIAYFAIVQDIWSFGNQPARQAGNRFSIGIDPNFLINRQTSKSFNLNFFQNPDTSSINKSLRGNFVKPALYLAFNHEKPLSEAWQESFRIKTEIGLGRESFLYEETINTISDSKESKAWNDLPSFEASANYSLEYFPNTRSSYHTYLSANFIQSKSLGNLNSITILPYEWTSAFLTLGFNAYYYVSPQTRLTFNYHMQAYSGSSIHPFLKGGGFREDFGDQAQFQQNASVSLDFAWF